MHILKCIVTGTEAVKAIAESAFLNKMLYSILFSLLLLSFALMSMLIVDRVSRNFRSFMEA